MERIASTRTTIHRHCRSGWTSDGPESMFGAQRGGSVCLTRAFAESDRPTRRASPRHLQSWNHCPLLILGGLQSDPHYLWARLRRTFCMPAGQCTRYLLACLCTAMQPTSCAQYQRSGKAVGWPWRHLVHALGLQKWRQGNGSPRQTDQQQHSMFWGQRG